MSFTGPTISGGSASYTAAPDWYYQYLADMAGLGGTLVKAQTYDPLTAKKVAPFTSDQELAFSKIKDAVGDWQPFATSAMGNFTNAAGGLGQMYDYTKDASDFEQSEYDTMYGQYKPTIAQMKTNATSIGQQNFQDTTLKQLNDVFSGTGQFGSGRHQILGSDAAARAQAEIEKQIASIEMGGRTQAMADYGNWAKQQGAMGAQMGQYAGNQVKLGTDLMNFGMGQQQAQFQEAAALGNIGTQQQQMNQQNMDVYNQNLQNQLNYPWQQLDKWASLTAKQTVPNYSSTVATPGMQAPNYTNPWLQGGQAFGGGWTAMNTMFGGS